MNRITSARIAVAALMGMAAALLPSSVGAATSYPAPATSFAVFPAGVQAYAAAVDQQQDGKFVVAGWATVSGIDKFAVARFNTDGSPDTSFGNGTGSVMTNVGLTGKSSAARDMRILDDGTIVLGGYAFWYRDAAYPAVGADPTKNTRVFAMLGLQPDGTPDPDFGSTYVGAGHQDGVVLTQVMRNDQITALAESGTTIIAAGTAKAQDPPGKMFALARYGMNGALDTTFGDNGSITTRFGGTSQNNTPLDVFVGANGDIVVIGTDNEPALGLEAARFAVAKFSQEGAVQKELKTLLSFDSEYNAAYAGELLPDGRILIAGNTFDATTKDLGAIIAELKPDLTPNPAFGSKGSVINFNPDWRQSAALSIEVQRDDGLLTAGAAATYVTGPVKWTLSRYWPDGTLDPAFGALGNLVSDVGAQVPDGVRNDGFDGSTDLLTLADGRSVATGTAQTTVGGDKTFGLAIYETTSVEYSGPTEELTGQWPVTATVTSSALCADGIATFVGSAGGTEVARATAGVRAGKASTTLSAPVGMDRVVVSYAPANSACLASSAPENVTSRAPEPTPPKIKQKPVNPLNLPAKLWRTGRTMLLEMPVRTNAGQKASVKVQALAKNRRAAGEVRSKDVRVVRRDQRLYVWLSGERDTRVKVTVKAPAVEGYTAYSHSKTYRTSAVR